MRARLLFWWWLIVHRVLRPRPLVYHRERNMLFRLVDDGMVVYTPSGWWHRWLEPALRGR